MIQSYKLEIIVKKTPDYSVSCIRTQTCNSNFYYWQGNISPTDTGLYIKPVDIEEAYMICLVWDWVTLTGCCKAVLSGLLIRCMTQTPFPRNHRASTSPRFKSLQITFPDWVWILNTVWGEVRLILYTFVLHTPMKDQTTHIVCCSFTSIYQIDFCLNINPAHRETGLIKRGSVWR